MTPPIFISHATADKHQFVTELRETLEDHDLPVWEDVRELRGGDSLKREIADAIEAARHFIFVLSPQTQNSSWVRRELKLALEVEERRRKTDGYRVVPLLLPGVEPTALELWFDDDERLGERVNVGPGGVSEALSRILAALGERAPEAQAKPQVVKAQPLEELVLYLSDPRIVETEGKRRAQATAFLHYEPADQTKRNVGSRRFTFSAPLGPIETDRLRWYLEDYFLWPTDIFQQQAAEIEKNLPQWGQLLYQAATVAASSQEPLNAWRQASAGGERRFSVSVDSEPPEGADDKTQAAMQEAASELLSLPWELLHDGRSYLFHGKNEVRVRRRMPNRNNSDPLPLGSLPIRILLVSPRPEQTGVGYIDHRASALPLVEAIASLGELVALTILPEPTLPALEKALQDAAEAKKPFDVVHFDGHGIYDKQRGLGGLCFEDPSDADKLEERAAKIIYADKLAEIARDHRIPLVFLEACQTAMQAEAPTSVAAKLLQEGVASVVAMSHSVLVETARRFVTVFYRELAQGRRVGAAMLAGQRELHNDDWRGEIMGAGALRLQDWFVPVLFQEELDPQLVTQIPSEAAQDLARKRRKLSLGELPVLPHKFQGRSRELLALERLLYRESYAVVLGAGGEGKTTLAVELARWLVQSGRFRQAAFVSLETYTDARSVLDALAHQLLPEGKNWSVAVKGERETLQQIERALRDKPTIIVLDNWESVLPDADGNAPAPLAELLDLCAKLMEADKRTRLVCTSRERLPAPFHAPHRVRPLGRLDKRDAISLLREVMRQHKIAPKSDDPGRTPDEIAHLVEAVNRHARALTLLAPHIHSLGVNATAQDLANILARHEAEHPGERENSLYASVELSLRRLPAALRQQARALAVFHGGAQMNVLAVALGDDINDTEGARTLASALMAVGLGQDAGDEHLRFDPALPLYLLREMDAAEQEAARTRWAAGMKALTSFLYQQRSQDTALSARLTQWETPNLLALLDWVAAHAAPEETVDLARQMEELLAPLGRTPAMASATRIRERAANRLDEWSHARFNAESAAIDRLLESGNLNAAYQAAQRILHNSRAVGATAYPDAAYDLAMAHFRLGRVLWMGGAAAEALEPLAEAHSRFQALADAGATDAAHMASAAIAERGGCLLDLGRLDEAAVAYEDASKRAEKLDSKRNVAVNKLQFGTVRKNQRRYQEALDSYQEAQDSFAALGEPSMVATAWHQIGIVHRQAKSWAASEQAYQQSLTIWTQQKNAPNEAASLGELGNLYDAQSRLEEAVTCYRKAADIYARLEQDRYEGVARSNLANMLIKLHRYDEARFEMHRAIKCKQPYGHAAEPWKTWAILCNLEQAIGNALAAAEARARAIAAYRAYRADGGENMDPAARLCALVAYAFANDAAAEASAQLDKYAAQVDEPWAKALLPKLQAILRGARDPSLAADPALYYDDAAELELLLARLNGS